MNTLNRSAACAIVLLLAACGAPTAAPEDGDHGAAHAEGTHAEGAHTEVPGAVAITPAQIRRAGIGIETAQAREIHEQLALYGTVQTNGERTHAVSARFPGPVRAVHVRVGDRVARGARLADVENDDSLEVYSVHSPAAGIVTQRDANVGEHAGEHPLFTVSDLGSIWVELALFPRDRARIRTGQPAHIRSPDLATTRSGRIDYISPIGVGDSQTLVARVELPNTDGTWTPGLHVAGTVDVATAHVPVAVRNVALQTLDDGPVVFVRTANGFRAVPVRTGRSDDAFTEIVSGLAAGTAYASEDSFTLKAELAKGEAEHDH